MIKNYVLFTRRYLGNRKSYRDKWEGVSKRKVSRFHRSFIRWPEVTILGVTTVQSFSNFNRFNRVSDEWLKIVFFTRRYLGNRKSYRDKWKSVSKRKVPRFYRFFIRWPEVTILKVTTVQSFSNFNRFNRVFDEWLKIMFYLHDDNSGTGSRIGINEKAFQSVKYCASIDLSFVDRK